MIYDLAIIGGGPAGYAAAFEAVRNRMTAVLFEKADMGGTCLNRGCVPTKYLNHAARKYYEARYRQHGGVLFQNIRIDFSKTLTEMNHMICNLGNGVEKQLHKDGIKIIKGNACIQDKCTIECNGEIFKAKNILISTGAEPSKPVVMGAMSSDDILRLSYIPEKLHIIGGGAVAVEFANIFQMFGSEVTISIRADRILRKWDKEIAVGVTQSMKRKGVLIQKNYNFSEFEAQAGTVVFSATGRCAVLPETNTELFQIGAGGGICVDSFGQTKTEGVYAAGDVVEGAVQLAHISMEQGRNVVRRIAQKRARNGYAVVKCIYLDQEAASVGLTEKEAAENGMDVVSAKQNMYSNARTLISTDERGFIKILADKKTRRIVGAHLFCERAGDLVSELAIGINQGLTVDEMADLVRPHPSYTEAVTEALRILEDKLDEI